MAGTPSVGGLSRVANDAIWRHIKIVFVASLLLFLVNILLGFDNAVTLGAIAHWKILTHLHAGAIGWITLSTIGLTFWIFTGARDVTRGYIRLVRLLGWVSIVAFSAYIVGIAITFSQGGDTMIVLPVLGTVAMVAIWAAALYAVTQFPRQPTASTIHLLLAGGLLVAGVGATMGVLIGLNYATGIGVAVTQAHAAPMLFYLFLVGSAIIEWFIRGGHPTKWTWPGLAQTVVLIIGAIIPPVAFLLNLEALAPVMLLMLGLFLIIFLVRVGWRALYTNPVRAGPPAWAFFATVWLVGVVVAFPAEILLQPNPPDWLLTVLAHAAFIGMMTNLLFGVIYARSATTRELITWAEPATMWLLNLGLVVFFALKISIDSRYGALIMGLGALLGIVTLVYRLRATRSPPPQYRSRPGP